MEYVCPRCKTEIVEITQAWAPNELDRRRYAQCPNCGWESDGEFDEYFMPEKEVILAEANGSRYIHGDVYEVTFEVKDYHWTYIMGTKYSWEGPVEITIRSLAIKERE